MSGWNGSMGLWYEQLAEQQRRERRAKVRFVLFLLALGAACGLAAHILELW